MARCLVRQTAQVQITLSLRKALIACVLPSALYGTEAWYGGRRQAPDQNRQGRADTVSCRLGGHIQAVEKALTIVLRGVLPVWKTTPNVVLFRDAAVSSAEAVLEEAKLRFAMRLQTVHEYHPLVRRITPPIIARGRGARRPQALKTKLQRLRGMKKAEAAKVFKEWWAELPPDVVTIFSDGSEQYDKGVKYAGYGYAIYQNGKELHHGQGSINTLSHVFDAEAIGAWEGLQRTLRDPTLRHKKIIHGPSHKCQDAMAVYDISVRWSPGHTGIEGNEAADGYADVGCREPRWDGGPAGQPTVSGIRSVYRELRDAALRDWWHTQEETLSTWYSSWGLTYTTKPHKELDLPRPTLQRLLAAWTSHGDFAWYHRKCNHPESTNLLCSCGKEKSPEHLVMCRKAQKKYKYWPDKPDKLDVPIRNDRKDAKNYLRKLLQSPRKFVKYLDVKEFYSKICPRG
ncbi:uncharacterized protein RAG0_02957 [Rhynchosporium agropyri]|uniref:Uncharacterized protein n=1 Tax=Rhynchosporium agropyri TaxID=914238 RepID=A0A1E1K2V9_9HELO|nr:uncharacterized protein RAG0_02957 [Rhynchosporium agropyri]